MSSIESTLMTHPAVAAAAALALPDRSGASVTSVIIAIDTDHYLELPEIQSWARERCAAEDLPKRWLFINQMPLREDGSPDIETLRGLVVGSNS